MRSIELQKNSTNLRKTTTQGQIMVCTDQPSVPFNKENLFYSRPLIRKNTILNNWYKFITACGNFGTVDSTMANAPVAERLSLGALFLNHLIISPLCLVWDRAPHWPHVRQTKFYLRVSQVVFHGVLSFSPTY